MIKICYPIFTQPPPVLLTLASHLDVMLGWPRPSNKDGLIDEAGHTQKGHLASLQLPTYFRSQACSRRLAH